MGKRKKQDSDKTNVTNLPQFQSYFSDNTQHLNMVPCIDCSYETTVTVNILLYMEF